HLSTYADVGHAERSTESNRIRQQRNRYNWASGRSPRARLGRRVGTSVTECREGAPTLTASLAQIAGRRPHSSRARSERSYSATRYASGSPFRRSPRGCLPSGRLLGRRRVELAFVQGANDGVVSVTSELDPRAQNEATKIFGYDDTHTGILSNAA